MDNYVICSVLDASDQLTSMMKIIITNIFQILSLLALNFLVSSEYRPFMEASSVVSFEKNYYFLLRATPFNLVD